MSSNGARKNLRNIGVNREYASDSSSEDEQAPETGAQLEQIGSANDDDDDDYMVDTNGQLNSMKKQDDDASGEQDDEDDMFADEDEETVAQSKKKRVEFAPVQADSLHSDAELENYDKDDEDDEDDEPRFESFSMKEEEANGKFDEMGNYIRNNPSSPESGADEDEYLAGFDRSEIRKARLAQRKRKQEDIQKAKSPRDGKMVLPRVEEMLADLIELLEPAESSTEALSRLHTSLAKLQKKKKTKNQKEREVHGHKKGKDVTIARITELCSMLSRHFDDSVYDMPREALMRNYQNRTGEAYSNKARTQSLKRPRETSEDEDENDDENDDEDYGEKIWEFRWLGDDVVNGPYSSYEMHHWKNSYFNNGVEARKLGEDEFTHIQRLYFTVD
ncbi:uncharacterized protein LODBEIA_P16950 [Lodderomyces beijingensis]|uniref:GYF domain-containing protein n=1 Tax=Lodderomyces beijingensis TaxID=1775926 RepID=A0ABP0ZKQ6_9ASCO